MAINLYNGFVNTKNGESYKCISSTEESFKIEWRVQPSEHLPFEHIHLNQDEIIHVKKGELALMLNGKASVIKAGNTITIKKGEKHLAFNYSDEMLECEIEYIPGLDSYQFFQCFGGLVIDNSVGKEGKVSIPKMCYFAKKMNAKALTRPSGIPGPLFNFILSFFYGIGVMFGWKRFYKKYAI